jgi:hypothetical protein
VLWFPCTRALAMHLLHRRQLLTRCMQSAAAAAAACTNVNIANSPKLFLPTLQDCLRRHPEVLDDLHKADEGLALPSAAR